MNLEIIRTQTTWNDAAGSINSNYAKIADAIAQLKANGGGGGADIDLTDYATKVWVEAKGYITASALTQYALKTDIPSLVGYATEDFVNNKLQNYTTTEDLVENYASKSDLESAINGIDLSVYLLKADLTKSRIKSTLGISDWALAATKPSYTAAEVGALSLSGGTVTGEFTVNGQPIVTKDGNATIVFSPNNREQNYWFGVNTDGNLFVTDNGYNNTYNIIHSGNIGSQSVNYATSAGTASKCLGIYTNNGGEQYPSYVTGGTTRWNMMRNSTTYYDKQLYEGYCDWMLMDNYTGFDVPYVTGIGVLKGDATRAFIMSGAKGTNNKWKIKELATLDSNVASATKLQTPRSIWGQSFDGTRSITGHLWSDTWRIVTDATFDGAFFQSKNYDGTSNAGNIYLTGWDVDTLESFNVRAKNSYFSNNIIANGNINASSVTVSGNVKASGNINATSITINGVTITASNGSITVNGNVFATGDITGGV